MKDKSKSAAKEWLFLYERGKLVGREEAEEKIDNLEKDRDLLREFLKKLKRSPDMWRPRKGPQGQDAYAGMPLMIREIDEILKEQSSDE